MSNRSGAVVSTTTTKAPVKGPAAPSKRGPPSMVLNNQRWLVENYDGDDSVVLPEDQLERKHAVYIANCSNCVIKVRVCCSECFLARASASSPRIYFICIITLHQNTVLLRLRESMRCTSQTAATASSRCVPVAANAFEPGRRPVHPEYTLFVRLALAYMYDIRDVRMRAYIAIYGVYVRVYCFIAESCRKMFH